MEKMMLTRCDDLNSLTKKHGREWLAGLAGKINERVKNG